MQTNFSRGRLRLGLNRENSQGGSLKKDAKPSSGLVFELKIPSIRISLLNQPRDSISSLKKKENLNEKANINCEDNFRRSKVASQKENWSWEAAKQKLNSLNSFGSFLNRQQLLVAFINIFMTEELCCKPNLKHLSERNKNIFTPLFLFTSAFQNFGSEIYEYMEANYPGIPSDYTGLDLHKATSASLGRRNELKIIANVDQKITIPKKKKTLNYSFGNINILFKFQCRKNEKENFWIQIEKFETKIHTEQQLTFLLKNVSYLEEKIFETKSVLESVTSKMTSMDNLVAEKQQQIQRMSKQLEEKQKLIYAYEQKGEEIRTYLYRQPSRFLVIGAEEYEKSRQKMYDLADFLQVTSAEKVDIWIGTAIKKADKNHERQIEYFCERKFDCNGRCQISKKQMENFQKSISNNYNAVINNYQKVLTDRITKIRNFITLMQNLAVSVVPKRQYLDQLNLKMAGTRASIQTIQKKIEKTFQSVFSELSKQKDIVQCYQELKGLIGIMSDLYMKAQIFY